MVDSVAEVRYQALRSKLNDLQYYQPLSTGSALLAERILVDIIKSVESFESLKKTADEQAKNLHESLEEVKILQEENPRILQENNSLHLKIIQDGEKDEQEDANARLELRSIDDSIENAAFVLQREMSATAKLEQEINLIRERIWQSMPHEQRPNQASKPELPESAPVPRSALAATAAVSDSVAKELAKCIQDCKDLEIELDSRTRLLEATRGQCNKLAAEVDAKGISVAALREKADLQRAQTSIAKLNTEVDLLNYQHEGLKTQQQQLKVVSDEVEQDFQRYRNRITDLQRDRDHWTDRMTQVQEAAARNRQRMAEECNEASSRRDNLIQSSKSLAVVNRGTRAKIESLRQSFAIDSASTARRISEAQLQLQVIEKSNEQQQTLLSSEMVHADTRLKLLQQQKRQLQDNCMRLATEVSLEQAGLARTREEVQAQSSEVSASSSSQSHALLHAEEINAQIARLESSSDSQRRTAEVLQSQLQSKKLRIQQGKTECESSKFQTNKLEQILETLTDTHNSMSEHLDHTLSGAQRAVEELEVASLREAPLQSENKSLRQSLAYCEENLAVVEDQQSSLKEEVKCWATEQAQEQERTKSLDAEMQQTHSEVKQTQERLLAIEAECATQQRSLAEEESEFKAKLTAVVADSDSLERKKDEACAEVYQEVQRFEESMSSIQTEIVELVQQKDNLVSSCARASSFRADSEKAFHQIATEVAKAQELVKESEVESSNIKVECNRALEARESLSQRTTGLLDELSELCQIVRRSGIEDHVLKQTVEEKRLRYSESLAQKTIYSRGMQGSKNILDEASVECNSLQEEVKQLTGMIAGLEAVKDRISEQIQEHHHEIDSERQLRTRVLESAAACSEQRGAAQAEVQALQQKLVIVDEQRDELQAVADEYAEEINSMKTESESLQDAMAEMQQMIHNLRQTIAVQKDQVKDRDRELALQRELEQQIKAGIAALDEKPFSIGPGETHAILQDLSNMTRENQVLHEDLRAMKKKVNAIQSATEEKALEQQQILRGLGAIRIEKDDVVHRYQLLQEQNQRRSAASNRINRQHLHMQESIKELTARLGAGFANEKEWRQLKLQTDTDLAAVREQLRSLAERLQSTESVREAAQAVSAQLQHNTALAQRTAHDAEVKWEKQEQYAASLGARYQHVEAETQRTFAEVIEARRALELGMQRQRALEELLLEQQIRSREVERENASLRRSLAMMDSEMEQTSDLRKEDLSALRQQLEEQYLLLGDQDATQLQAAAEVRGLRQELQALRSTPGPGT